MTHADEWHRSANSSSERAARSTSVGRLGELIEMTWHCCVLHRESIKRNPTGGYGVCEIPLKREKLGESTTSCVSRDPSATIYSLTELLPCRWIHRSAGCYPMFLLKYIILNGLSLLTGLTCFTDVFPDICYHWLWARKYAEEKKRCYLKVESAV